MQNHQRQNRGQFYFCRVGIVTMADGMTASRFALEQRDVQARPIGNTSRDRTLSAAVARHPAAAEMDSRVLKLVPFVCFT